MLFTDPTFLISFLPLLLSLYFISVRLSKRISQNGARELTGANWVLLVTCIGFYIYGGGTFTWVIACAIAFNHGMAHMIHRIRRPTFLVLSIAANIGLLGVFKYWAPTTTVTFDPNAFAVPQLLVPFGLSIFALHATSYLMDVYRHAAEPHRSPVPATIYLLFFPLLIAGPIVRYRDLDRQLSHRLVGMAAFAYGVRRFVIGLGKTLLIANTLAVPADQVFSLSPASLGAVHAWLGLTCFTLQIYFDLSGYADMAVGIGRMLGFRLQDNFRGPYVADSLHEFWRRWNVTLMGWLRTYGTLSLDTKRDDQGQGSGRLLMLFMFVGLWHGPGWNVIGWGLYHGVVVVLERIGLGTIINRFPALFRHAYVVLVVMVGWVVFRTDNLPDILLYMKALAGLNMTPTALELPLTTAVWIALVVGVIGSAPLVSWLSRWRVMLDAITTSLLMVVSTTSRFAWRRGSNVVGTLPRRRRSPGTPSGASGEDRSRDDS